MDSSGVYLSGIFHGTFPKAVYSTMIAEKFQIYSVKITGKYICQSKKKKESVHFYSCLQPKLSPVFISTLQAEGNYPFLPNSVFWRSIFSLAEKGERIMELIKLPNLNVRRYWSQVLINSTIFTFLASVLLCHNLASSMLKWEGSLT